MDFNTWNTAISRKGPSAPLKHILKKSFPKNKDISILDYGCGKGADVKYLKSLGYRAVGWDPYYVAKGVGKPREKFNEVLLTYVINCISELKQRELAIMEALDYVKLYGNLYITVRNENEIEKARTSLWMPYGDGWISSFEKSTFQRGYDPKSLESLVCSLSSRNLRESNICVDDLSTSRFSCIKVQRISED